MWEPAWNERGIGISVNYKIGNVFLSLRVRLSHCCVYFTSGNRRGFITSRSPAVYRRLFVRNLSLTAGYSALIFTQTLVKDKSVRSLHWLAQSSTAKVIETPGTGVSLHKHEDSHAILNLTRSRTLLRLRMPNFPLLVSLCKRRKFILVLTLVFIAQVRNTFLLTLLWTAGLSLRPIFITSCTL